jgi:hypothetical protein
MRAAKLNGHWAIAAALVAGCGNGSGTAEVGTTASPLDNAATLPSPPVLQKVLAYGAAIVHGDVWVNNVRYDMSTATITIDGRPATAADIASGDVVFIAATGDANNFTRAVAERATIDDSVEGPITAIDAAASSLVALGQTVRVTSMTVLDGLRASIAELAVGDIIEVAGFRNSNGDILATRVEKKSASDALEATGVVTALDRAARRLMIGALVVDYGTVAEVPAELRSGEIVEVKGAALLPEGALVASSVERARPLSGAPGDRVELEGYVTSFEIQGQFAVSGVPTRITNDTLVVGDSVAPDVKVTVSGSLDAAQTVVASNVRNLSGPAPPADPPSFVPGTGPIPPTGHYSIVGQIFDSTSGADLGSVPINLWVQTPRFGYSYWWANGALYSNPSGGFVAMRLPAAQIMIHAGHRHLVQPCAVILDVPGGGFVSLEVMSVEAFDTLNPPRPHLVRGTSITGTAFETANGVRQPASGAKVWAYTGFETDIASTMTDLQGRFFLCNLPSDVYLEVWKDRVKLEWQVDSTAASPLEFDIKRR